MAIPRPTTLIEKLEAAAAENHAASQRYQDAGKRWFEHRHKGIAIGLEIAATLVRGEQ